MRTEASGNDRKPPRRNQLIRQDLLALKAGLTRRRLRDYAGALGWRRWFLDGRLFYERGQVREFVESRRRARRAS